MATNIRRGLNTRFIDGLDRQRIGGLVLDVLVLSVIFWWVNLTFGVERAFNGLVINTVATNFSGYTTTRSVEWLWLLLITFLYFVLQEGLLGATIGKQLVGLRVVGREGRRITFGQAFVRNLLRPIDALPGFYLVGGLMTLNSPLRQRLGDRVAGTIVVNVRGVPQTALPTAQIRLRAGGLVIMLTLLLAASLACAYFVRPALEVENLYKTGQFPFEKPTSGYVLGTPVHSGDTLTYPIDLQQPGSTSVCHASMRMEWHGFLQQWTVTGGNRAC